MRVNYFRIFPYTIITPGQDSMTSSDTRVILNEHIYEHLGKPTPRKSRPMQLRRLLRTSVIVVSTTFSFVAFCLSFFVLVRAQLVEGHRCDEASLCIPCSSVVWEEDLNVNSLRRYHRNGVEVCCAETPEQLATMMDMIYDKRNKGNKQPYVKGDRRKERTATVPLPRQPVVVAAHHLLGNLLNEHKHQVTSEQIKDSHSYYSGVRKHKDHLIIVTGGLYYINSQIYFKVLVGNGEKKPQLLGHQVHRFGAFLPNDRHERLLQTVHTCAENSNRDLYLHTSYVGGIFHLDPGNEIYVKVSNSSLVSRDPRLSFLEVYKIG